MAEPERRWIRGAIRADLSAVLPDPRRAAALFGVVAAGLLSGCAADRLGGACAEDEDCPSGQVCVLDLKEEASGEVRPETYCSLACASDRACPDFQRCRSGSLGSGSPVERYCIDRVRSCGTDDPKNGLDDDCDGVVDPADGAFITGCLDDAPCGAFVCRAPPGQAETICAPAESDPPVGDFSRCARDDDCRNGLCEAGICSPMCRPRPATSSSETCAAVNLDGASRGTACVRALDELSRPAHNLCHVECGDGRSCPEGTACVWRDTVGATDDRHFFVCSALDPNRLPLGAECPSNRPEDDRACQYGLCFGLRCTRRCGGPGSDCSDVGSGFTCREQILFYGVREFPTFVCVEGSGGS